MRILHIIPSLSPLRGGASKAAIDMVLALGSIGAEVEIACTNDHGPDTLEVPLGQLIEYEGVRVRFFKRFSPGISAIREFAYSATFKQWLDQNISTYDIVHVHALFSFTSSYAMFRARKNGVPYIAHPIGSLEQWSLEQGSAKKKLFLSLFDRENLHGASGVHFTAESEKQQALKTAPNLKPFVVPLGLDAPEIDPLSREKLCCEYRLAPDDLLLLFLGRLHPKKGLEMTLDALAQAPELNYNLLIAGTGDIEYEQSLKLKVNTLGLADRVQFTGYVRGESKSNLLQGADLFVLNSYSENFGIAVLESLANGTPVLLCPGVALSEQVKEHNLGVVCAPDAREIAKQLTLLGHNRADLAEYGIRGLRYVKEQHNWQSLASKLLHQYQSILNNSN